MDWTLPATETVPKADTVLEEKGEINELEIGKHSTYTLPTDMTELAEFCMSTGTKGGLA